MGCARRRRALPRRRPLEQSRQPLCFSCRPPVRHALDPAGLHLRGGGLPISPASSPCSGKPRGAPSMPASTSSTFTAPTAPCRCSCCRAISTGAAAATAATSPVVPGCGWRSWKRCAPRPTASARSPPASRSISSRAPRGVEAVDDGLRFVEHVTRLGLVDLWDVNISSLEEWGEDAGPSRFYRSNHQAPWTSEVRKHRARSRSSASAASPIRTRWSAFSRSGQLDIIGCARPSIADPWLPRKVDEGRSRRHRRMHRLQPVHRPLRIRRADRLHAEPDGARGVSPRLASRTLCAAQPRDELIAVVGAGPAGLECARVLGRRGYRVHLIEAETAVGRPSAPRRRAAGTGRVVSRRELSRERSSAAWATSRSCWERARRRRKICWTTAAAKIVLATGAGWNGDGRGPAGPDPIPGIDAALPGFVTPEQLFAGKAVGEAWRSSTATATSWP